MGEQNQIKCLIVDDEPLAIKVICNHLAKVPFAEATATAISAMDAVNKIREFPIDLVFLDIEMPEISGIDLVKGLPEPPTFIFVTAYREFAAEAFDLDALDYLVKPVSFPRFLKAINKYKQMNENVSKDLPVMRVKVDRSIQNLIIDRICYIEGLKDYVKIWQEDATTLITRETMTAMENRLSKHGFLRCHKSYLIPLRQVTKFSADSLEIRGTRLPIGRKYREVILKALQG